MAPDAEALSAKAPIGKATSKSAHRRAAEPAAVSAEPIVVEEVSPTTTAAPAPSSGSGAAAPAVIPDAASGVTAPEGPPAPKRESNARPDGGSPPAVVEAGDAIGPQPLVVADARSTSTTPTPSTEAADDLTPVRTKDPQAADRIVSYCSKFTTATNAATVAARCRRDEMDAWTRLTVQNEFPNLDESSRRKCSDPPFPNSFVALESCAKYQLHLD